LTTPSRDHFDLTGRVAIVTGGSRGLGWEVCQAYALAGASVVVASRDGALCMERANALHALTGGDFMGVACHVGVWSACERLFEATRERFGRVDILVNNAGMSPTYPSLDEVSEDLFDKVIAVNLKGPFRLAVLAASHMEESGTGSIINVSSASSLEPTRRELPYAIAKGGLNVLTIGLAHACGPNVRVNGIMPGPFLTDIAKAWDPESFRRYAESRIALRRGGQPGEIVGAALYLASDAASYTTGAVIKVDGGATWSAA
jgi:NAD(P)-dependent dehydrogenase (short-subunit alcohol dehydrogenase family)